MHGGAAERVDGELEAGGANGLHVDNVAQIGDIWKDEVFLLCRVGSDGCSEAHAFHAEIALAQDIVGPVLDPPGHVDICWTSVSCIVLESAVLRRVMRRGDDNPVSKPGRFAHDCERGLPAR
jgi:hypothetical protein